MTFFQKLLGTAANWRESGLVSLSMLLVTYAFSYICEHFIPDYQVTTWEFLATWTGLTCVWLVRTRNIQNWPWAVASAITTAVMFYPFLMGQVYLFGVFFLFTAFYGWYVWFHDMEADLPVTMLSGIERLAWVLRIAVVTGLVMWNIQWFAPESQWPFLDAVVVASSMAAQVLLNYRKVESWILWLGPVNAVSIVLYAMAGKYVFAGLYVAFFCHAVVAMYNWIDAKEWRDSQQRSALE